MIECLFGKKSAKATAKVTPIPIKQGTFEDAAAIVHDEWMKRNPKQDWNAAQHVPYKDLSEDEKDKDRLQVNIMLELLKKYKHIQLTPKIEYVISNEFAEIAHEEWRRNLATKAPRMKDSINGKVDINVEWSKLHPEWKYENYAAGQAAIDAIITTSLL
jgi:hypothetical protein